MNLAIQGHSNRGNEVIALLKMLGGENPYGCNGLGTLCAYHIVDGNIQVTTIEDLFKSNEYILYNLEGILAKFPYKVGNSARLSRSNIAVVIKAMKWENDEVVYKLSCDDSGWWSIDNLKPYKETNTESNKCTYCVYAVNNNHCGLRGFRSNFNVNYCSAQNVDKLPNGFELQEDGYFSWVNEKPKYPTTYVECAKTLNCFGAVHIDGYKNELLEKLQELLICRDAYWKIAGDEYQLGKPWEPDWENKGNTKYGITTINRQVKIITTDVFNYFLIFPTPEMRDTFYENFKDLIESCKELL